MNRLSSLIIRASLGTILCIDLMASGVYCEEAGLIPEGAYQYLEQSGNDTSLFEWRISYPGDLVEIHVESQEYRTFNRCRPDGETIFWSADGANGQTVSAVRQNDVLVVTQTGGGGQKTVDYDIDHRPWYQPLSYSLRELLSEVGISVEFWSVRMDTNEPVLLKATRVGSEPFSMGIQMIPAIKVEIRAAGLLSMFWSGSFWFSQENYLFLHSRSRTSLPGMADKTISLVSWPDK